MNEHQPIPCGYYLILKSWIETPEDWFSCNEVAARSRQPAYMHLWQMAQLELLEVKNFMVYRPTIKGWLAFHDYQCNFKQGE